MFIYSLYVFMYLDNVQQPNGMLKNKRERETQGERERDSDVILIT